MPTFSIIRHVLLLNWAFVPATPHFENGLSTLPRYRLVLKLHYPLVSIQLPTPFSVVVIWPSKTVCLISSVAGAGRLLACSGMQTIKYTNVLASVHFVYNSANDFKYQEEHWSNNVTGFLCTSFCQSDCFLFIPFCTFPKNCFKLIIWNLFHLLQMLTTASKMFRCLW